MSETNNTSTHHIVMYESKWCGFCRAAKRMLAAKGWDYESRSVDGNANLRAEMTSLTGRTSVPQIFFGEQHIGGYDDMAELEERGELDAVLAKTQSATPDGNT